MVVPENVHAHAQSRDIDYSITAHPTSHVQSVNHTEHSKLLPWLMLTGILSGAAVVTSIVSGIVAWENSNEAKQVQIQLMYANAIMLREGLVQPGDMVYGPEGNLEYRQHELKRKEK